MALANSLATVEPVIEKYLKALEDAGIRTDAAYIFGSYVLGRSDKWSDIDIAVVSESLSGDLLEDEMRLARLTWDIDVRIEPHPFRPEDFTPDNPWAAEIMRTGIKIV